MTATAPDMDDTAQAQANERQRQYEDLIANSAVLIRQGKYSSDLIDATYEALASMRATDEASDAATMGDLIARYDEQVEQWQGAASTGIGHLDTMLGGGILPKRLIALLGPPGMGKSSLACQIGETVAHQGRPVVYLTSEDSPHMLICRSLARLSNLDYGLLLRGKVLSAEFARAATDYQNRGSATRMLVIEQRGPFSLDTLRQRAKAHMAAFNPDGTAPGLLIVDYLQRLARSGKLDNMELRQAVTALTEQLRDVAKDLGCCVMVLSAQNRDAYKNNGSGNTLASGKESGDLEYTADALMSIMPADEKPGNERNPKADRHIPAPGHATRLLRLDKNRQGETGTIPLDWYGPRQSFSEVY